MKSIKQWCDYIAKWREKKGFETDWDNVPEKLMLVVTELAEAMEGYRKITWKLLSMGGLLSVKNTPTDESKPYMDNFKEELADTVIRLFDLAGSLDIDLEKEISKKMKINERRPQKHGKNC